MKTQGLTKILLLGWTLLFLVSCNDEEFYEKEFIETYQEKYDEEIFENCLAEFNGDASICDGSNGSNGSGGSTGTSGTTGTDGSNGSTGTTGTDGSNGSTGTTGTDGSNGSTGTNGGVVLEDREENFDQVEGPKKMDILWVIDNSGSMGDEQAALAYNFDAFIQDFVLKNIDFKMAITTTDTSSESKAGRPVSGSMTELTTAKYNNNPTKFMNDFEDMIQVGTSGSGREKGILASEKFTQKHAQANFREDAYYIVVYVSDEEDQSPNTPSEHLTELRAWKQNEGLVKAYSIVKMSGSWPSWAAQGYERYEAMATMTQGLTTDINNDFYNTLLQIGSDIANLADQYPLAEVPYDENDIQVYLDGVEQASGWSYNSSSNTIQFDVAPPAGTQIKVTYQVEQ